MVNALSLDFGFPLPRPSMIVLEICLLCELTSTFTDKMVRSSLHMCPHTKDRAVQYSDQEWVGGIVYMCIKKPSEWKIFFQIIFVPIYIDFYITYNYLFI